MNQAQHEMEARTYLREMLFKNEKLTPVEWCEQFVRFNEPDNQGPFESRRREYLIEPLNDFADRTIQDAVLCFGSQTGKTSILIGGVTWCIKNDPCGIFWVMPTTPLARKFSKQRLMPCLRLSVRDLIPVKELRNGFTALDMQVGASVVNLTGSNSPANLSSTPARRIILDEVDKFDEGGRGEADAVNLAEQRCKNVNFPQRWKTSTPTLNVGLIWEEFKKGDQRRYYLPCPHCKKFVVLAWSKKFSIFKPTGNEAFIQWDVGAKANGKWDLDRVEKSAHALCPHCYGEIRDGHKTVMIRDGQWRPMNPTAPSSFRSRHLPSMYSTAPESNFGKMAKRFLQSMENMNLQGFINGDLAEPYQSQETEEERIELVTNRVAVEVTTEWRKMLTVDCQRRAPHFWHVARAWNGKDSEAFSAGPLNTWEDIRAIQQAHKIPDVCVAVDSGYGAKDDAEVYKNCARFGEMVDIPQTGLVQFAGWIPTKGMPSRKRWKSDDGILLPWHLSEVDPYDDTTEAGIVKMPLLEFSSDYYKDIFARFRAQEGGVKWSVTSGVGTDEYWQQVNGWKREEVKAKFGSRKEIKWMPKHNRWPDHIGDCEVLQIMLASFHGFFSVD